MECQLILIGNSYIQSMGRRMSACSELAGEQLLLVVRGRAAQAQRSAASFRSEV